MVKMKHCILLQMISIWSRFIIVYSSYISEKVFKKNTSASFQVYNTEPGTGTCNAALYDDKFFLPHKYWGDCNKIQKCKNCESFTIEGLTPNWGYKLNFKFPGDWYGKTIKFHTLDLVVSFRYIMINPISCQIYVEFEKYTDVTKCQFRISLNNVNIGKCTQQCSSCYTRKFDELSPNTEYKVYYKNSYMDKPVEKIFTTAKTESIIRNISTITSIEVILDSHKQCCCDANIKVRNTMNYVLTNCVNIEECRACNSFKVKNLIPNSDYTLTFKNSADKNLDLDFRTNPVEYNFKVNALCSKAVFSFDNNDHYKYSICELRVFKGEKILLNCKNSECGDCINFKITLPDDTKSISVYYKTPYNRIALEQDIIIKCPIITQDYIQVEINLIEVRVTLSDNTIDFIRCNVELPPKFVVCIDNCSNLCTNYNLRLDKIFDFNITIRIDGFDVFSLITIKPSNLIIKMNGSIVGPSTYFANFSVNIFKAGICSFRVTNDGEDINISCVNGKCHDNCDDLRVEIFSLNPNKEYLLEFTNTYLGDSYIVPFTTKNLKMDLELLTYPFTVLVNVTTNIEPLYDCNILIHSLENPEIQLYKNKINCDKIQNLLVQDLQQNTDYELILRSIPFIVEKSTIFKTTQTESIKEIFSTTTSIDVILDSHKQCCCDANIKVENTKTDVLSNCINIQECQACKSFTVKDLIPNTAYTLTFINSAKRSLVQNFSTDSIEYNFKVKAICGRTVLSFDNNDHFNYLYCELSIFKDEKNLFQCKNSECGDCINFVITSLDDATSASVYYKTPYNEISMEQDINIECPIITQNYTQVEINLIEVRVTLSDNTIDVIRCIIELPPNFVVCADNCSDLCTNYNLRLDKIFNFNVTIRIDGYFSSSVITIKPSNLIIKMNGSIIGPSTYFANFSVNKFKAGICSFRLTTNGEDIDISCVNGKCHDNCDDLRVEIYNLKPNKEYLLEFTNIYLVDSYFVPFTTSTFKLNMSVIPKIIEAKFQIDTNLEDYISCSIDIYDFNGRQYMSSCNNIQNCSKCKPFLITDLRKNVDYNLTISFSNKLPSQSLKFHTHEMTFEVNYVSNETEIKISIDKNFKTSSCDANVTSKDERNNIFKNCTLIEGCRNCENFIIENLEPCSCYAMTIWIMNTKFFFRTKICTYCIQANITVTSFTTHMLASIKLTPDYNVLCEMKVSNTTSIQYECNFSTCISCSNITVHNLMPNSIYSFLYISPSISKDLIEPFTTNYLLMNASYEHTLADTIYIKIFLTYYIREEFICTYKMNTTNVICMHECPKLCTNLTLKINTTDEFIMTVQSPSMQYDNYFLITPNEFILDILKLDIHVFEIKFELKPSLTNGGNCTLILVYDNTTHIPTCYNDSCPTNCDSLEFHIINLPDNKNITLVPLNTLLNKNQTHMVATKKASVRLQIKVTDFKAKISFVSNYNATSGCFIELFSSNTLTSDFNCSKNDNCLRCQPFSIVDLTPNTNYNLSFSHLNGKYTIDYKFTTDYVHADIQILPYWTGCIIKGIFTPEFSISCSIEVKFYEIIIYECHSCANCTLINIEGMKPNTSYTIYYSSPNIEDEISRNIITPFIELNQSFVQLVDTEIEIIVDIQKSSNQPIYCNVIINISTVSCINGCPNDCSNYKLKLETTAPFRVLLISNGAINSSELHIRPKTFMLLKNYEPYSTYIKLSFRTDFNYINCTITLFQNNLQINMTCEKICPTSCQNIKFTVMNLTPSTTYSFNITESTTNMSKTFSLSTISYLRTMIFKNITTSSITVYSKSNYSSNKEIDECNYLMRGNINITNNCTCVTYDNLEDNTTYTFELTSSLSRIVEIANATTVIASVCLTAKIEDLNAIILVNKNFDSSSGCNATVTSNRKINDSYNCSDDLYCFSCTNFTINGLLPATNYLVKYAYLNEKYTENINFETDYLTIVANLNIYTTNVIANIKVSPRFNFTCVITIRDKNFVNIQKYTIKECSHFELKNLSPKTTYMLTIYSSYLKQNYTKLFTTASFDMILLYEQNMEYQADILIQTSSIRNESVSCTVSFNIKGVTCREKCPSNCSNFTVYFEKNEPFVIFITSPNSKNLSSLHISPKAFMYLKTIDSHATHITVVLLSNFNYSKCSLQLLKDYEVSDITCSTNKCPSDCHNMSFTLIDLNHSTFYTLIVTEGATNMSDKFEIYTTENRRKLDTIKITINSIAVSSFGNDTDENIDDICNYKLAELNFAITNNCSAAIFYNLQDDTTYRIILSSKLSSKSDTIIFRTEKASLNMTLQVTNLTLKVNITKNFNDNYTCTVSIKMDQKYFNFDCEQNRNCNSCRSFEISDLKPASDYEFTLLWLNGKYPNVCTFRTDYVQLFLVLTPYTTSLIVNSEILPYYKIACFVDIKKNTRYVIRNLFILNCTKFVISSLHPETEYSLLLYSQSAENVIQEKFTTSSLSITMKSKQLVESRLEIMIYLDYKLNEEFICDIYFNTSSARCLEKCPDSCQNFTVLLVTSDPITITILSPSSVMESVLELDPLGFMFLNYFEPHANYIALKLYSEFNYTNCIIELRDENKLTDIKCMNTSCPTNCQNLNFFLVSLEPSTQYYLQVTENYTMMMDTFEIFTTENYRKLELFSRSTQNIIVKSKGNDTSKLQLDNCVYFIETLDYYIKNSCDEANFLNLQDDTTYNVTLKSSLSKKIKMLTVKTVKAELYLTFAVVNLEVSMHPTINFNPKLGCNVNLKINNSDIGFKCQNQRQCYECEQFLIGSLTPATKYTVYVTYVNNKYSIVQSFSTDYVKIELNITAYTTVTILQSKTQPYYPIPCSINIQNQGKIVFQCSNCNNCSYLIIHGLPPGSFYSLQYFSPYLKQNESKSWTTPQLFITQSYTQRIEYEIDIEVKIDSTADEEFLCNISFSNPSVSCKNLCPTDCRNFKIIFKKNEKFTVRINSHSSLNGHNLLINPLIFLTLKKCESHANYIKLELSTQFNYTNCQLSLFKNYKKINLSCMDSKCPTNCMNMNFIVQNLEPITEYTLKITQPATGMEKTLSIMTSENFRELKLLHFSYNGFTVTSSGIDNSVEKDDLCTYTLEKKNIFVENDCSSVAFSNLTEETFYIVLLKSTLSFQIGRLEVKTGQTPAYIPTIKHIERLDNTSLIIVISNKYFTKYNGVIRIYKTKINALKMNQVQILADIYLITEKNYTVTIRNLSYDYIYQIEICFNLENNCLKNIPYSCSVCKNETIHLCNNDILVPQLQTAELNSSGALVIEYNNETIDCHSKVTCMIYVSLMLRRNYEHFHFNKRNLAANNKTFFKQEFGNKCMHNQKLIIPDINNSSIRKIMVYSEAYASVTFLVCNLVNCYESAAVNIKYKRSNIPDLIIFTIFGCLGVILLIAQVVIQCRPGITYQYSITNQKQYISREYTISAGTLSVTDPYNPNSEDGLKILNVHYIRRPSLMMINTSKPQIEKKHHRAKSLNTAD